MLLTAHPESPRRFQAPWNASWSSESRVEIRPCRWAGNRLALWSPHSPGQGRPIFAKPHPVRQRRSIAEMRCTVCGEQTSSADRWWFGLGSHLENGWFATTESPVHRRCADLALDHCPRLAELGRSPEPLPSGWSVIAAFVGGPVAERDFGVRFHGRVVIGHLKLAWPAGRIRPRP